MSENALMTTEHADAIRTALKTSLYPGASDDSVSMVLSYCKAAALDPITKPVHIVPVWDSKSGGMRDVVMPGIGLYRTIAARCGCAGISEPEFGPDMTEAVGGQQITFPLWCRVTVRRIIATGQTVDFTAKEFWKENYAIKGGKDKSIAPNAMWTKRPYAQLAKCAQAQALRMGFPEIGAQPTADEIDPEADLVSGSQSPKLTVVQSARPEIKPYPAADFDANLPRWRAVIESGKKTADEIVTMVETKGVLTDAQRDAIHACAVQHEGGAQ